MWFYNSRFFTKILKIPVYNNQQQTTRNIKISEYQQHNK